MKPGAAAYDGVNIALPAGIGAAGVNCRKKETENFIESMEESRSRFVAPAFYREMSPVEQITQRNNLFFHFFVISISRSGKNFSGLDRKKRFFIGKSYTDRK